MPKFNVARRTADGGMEAIIDRSTGEIRDFNSVRAARRWIQRNIVSPKARRELLVVESRSGR